MASIIEDDRFEDAYEWLESPHGSMGSTFDDADYVTLTSGSQLRPVSPDTSMHAIDEVAPAPLQENRPLTAGDKVDIISGKYKKQAATFEHSTAKMAYVKLEADEKVVRISKQSICYASDGSLSQARSVVSNPSRSARALVRRTVGASTPSRLAVRGAVDPTLHSFLHLPLEFIQLTTQEKAQRVDCLAKMLFGDRILVCKLQPEANLSEVPSVYSTPDGRTYQLLSIKLHKHAKAVSSASKLTTVEMDLVYVMTSGPESIDVQLELDKFANFGQLAVEKAVARLELLQSTARASTRQGPSHLIFDDLTASDFELIDEDGHEGCGFIPREYIERFLGSHAVGKRTMALQVRMVAPRIGIAKGMLVEKTGITKIQLPQSMLKVGPSVKDNAGDEACFLITSNGVFPSTTHLHMAKLLDGQRVADSFQRNKLGSMAMDLLEARGVPRSIVKQYQNDSYSNYKTCLKHSFLVGVADPTGAIPPGHVFVTGMNVLSVVRDKVFVTRFPCTKESDGPLLPILRSKPASMSDRDWEMLHGFAFGAIIFGSPAPGHAALPTMIANGDLDGDLYFVLWDPDLLSHMSPIELVSEASEPSTASLERPLPNNWFADAQELMRDIGKPMNRHKLIGKLYKLRDEVIHELGYHHRDAMAFGAAYRDAIDTGKHGGSVRLPARLWPKVPAGLHCFLIDC